MLFVPAGCPHRVENLEQSIAISANFVDPSNLKTVVKELEINALVDPRTADLLGELKHKCAAIIQAMDMYPSVAKEEIKKKNECEEGSDSVVEGTFKGCDDYKSKRTDDIDYDIEQLLESPNIKKWLQKVTNVGHLKWNKFKQ